ncbi:26s proteasome regulatory particle subunit [Echinococcus multilocularis]|uniref:26S proteasome non-ATPase regulatory subunit 2 n=1 Tax=Echinococcus multilocularis TaxID=6211 RepID=A0A087W1P8_ECHMU|nr:26s proteasome regulatory particle subunit [Echinococcus multilocularis]
MAAEVASNHPKDADSLLNKTKDNLDDDLSDEDRQLRDELYMLLQRLEEPNVYLYETALESLKNLIKSSTTSMTSVPKPLKFLRPQYARIKNIYENIQDPKIKALCAEVVSVVGMITYDNPDYKTDTLKYRLLSKKDDIGVWGHEYVRLLTKQIAEVWDETEVSGSGKGVSEKSMKQKEYLGLAGKIIPYLMEHNAESEAIDLCMEIENLDFLENYTTELNFQRVCLYLISCAAYIPDPDNVKVLRCAENIYRKYKDLGNALRYALRLNDESLARSIFNEAASLPTSKYGATGTDVRRQLAYLLGRHQFIVPYDEVIAEEDEDLAEMLGNTRLSEHFLSLARELDIMDPKLPEDVYKQHLEPTRLTMSSMLDTMRTNTAASYVNGLINCGFGREKLIQDEGKDGSWLSRQKDLGKMSAVASLGWVMLWDVDSGLSQIDKYLYAVDDHTQAGALLGCGVVNCGVKNECDPALALLSSYVEHQTDVLSRAAIIGLGVAYAGSNKMEAINHLVPAILDSSSGRLQHACLASLSAGMIAVGSMNEDVTSTIIQTMLERPAAHWNNTFSKFMALGLALTCLGRQDEAEVILASLEAVTEPMKSMAHMMCDVCAYACSGNVLKIQKLLHILSEKYEEKTDKVDKAKSTSAGAEKSKSKDHHHHKKDSRRTAGNAGNRRVRRHANSTGTKPSTESTQATTEEPMQVDEQAASSNDDANVPSTSTQGFDYHAHQGLAVLGVAIIAMGEEVGLEMAFRMFGHLLRFGETPIKRIVPLALALCYISNPQLKVLDTLSKFSHDSDPELCYNSILAMGIVGAGTNSARLAAMLRQLAGYHCRDPYNLFLVRLAQGLTHLGKGTLTLSPWHSDHALFRPVSLAGLLTLLVSCLEMRMTFMGRSDYLIFYLTPAIQPRLLMTFDKNLKPLTVTVRVGQAVDVVGQAGRPKTITGFQTHTTPVLLAHGERAELATDEYVPVTNLPLEGFVILTKNPSYEKPSV